MGMNLFFGNFPEFNSVWTLVSMLKTRIFYQQSETTKRTRTTMTEDPMTTTPSNNLVGSIEGWPTWSEGSYHRSKTPFDGTIGSSSQLFTQITISQNLNSCNHNNQSIPPSFPSTMGKSTTSSLKKVTPAKAKASPKSSQPATEVILAAMAKLWHRGNKVRVRNHCQVSWRTVQINTQSKLSIWLYLYWPCFDLVWSLDSWQEESWECHSTQQEDVCKCCDKAQAERTSDSIRLDLRIDQGRVEQNEGHGSWWHN